MARWAEKAAAKFGSDRVSICSLTRAAAAEIAGRKLPIPKGNIGTLHSICYRALGSPEIADGEGNGHIAEWNTAHPAFFLSPGSLKIDEVETREGTVRGETEADRWKNISQSYRHRAISREAWPDDVRIFQERWEAWMKENDLVDFTGLIERALDVVPMAPSLPSALFVDEAQDSSLIELRLIRKWSAHAEYAVLGGDSDQCIYQFRGSRPRDFLEPKIPEEHNSKLTESFRVPAKVVAVARDWISQASWRYSVDYQPRLPKYGKSAEGSVERLDQIRYVVGDRILPIIDREREDGNRVMILGACGYMLDRVIGALRKEGWPFFNPYRKTNGAWNPLRGGAHRIADFLRPDPRVYGKGLGRLWNWRELKAWSELVRASETFVRGAKKEIAANAKRERNEEGAPRLDAATMRRLMLERPLSEMGNAFQESTDAALGWLRGRLLPSRDAMCRYAFRVAERRGAIALIDEPTIIVGTIHSVKGGESDTVVLFPDLSRAGHNQWIWPGEEHRDAVLRQFYVGMTRARERLILCGASDYEHVDWV